MEAPILRADGTVLETPGYDRKTGLLYLPEIEYPKVPETPSREDAAAAAESLHTLVAEFPFKDLDHRAAWVAAVVTPFARFAVHGPCPMFVFDANAAGSGKTLLCDLVSLIGTGRSVGRTTYPASEEEMDKCTLAMALGGARLVLFDNQATGTPIGGAALDGALTAQTRSGRVLGVSKFAQDVPFHALICCTGNNLGIRGDTLRRVVLCRLESAEERPEERDDFQIPDLLHHVRSRRGELAVAALTVLKAYVVAGRPVPTYGDGSKPKPMGAPFDTWANLVRRAIHWTTDHDPLATKAEAKSADKTATTLPALIEGWDRLCREAQANSLSTTEALKALEGNPGTHEALRAVLTEATKDGKLPSPQALGNTLGRVRGRPVAGRSLERTEAYGVNRWFVKIHTTSAQPAQGGTRGPARGRTRVQPGCCPILTPERRRVAGFPADPADPADPLSGRTGKTFERLYSGRTLPPTVQTLATLRRTAETGSAGSAGSADRGPGTECLQPGLQAVLHKQLVTSIEVAMPAPV